MKEIVKISGRITDVGSLPEGRGFAIDVEGESVCVIGLTVKEVGRVAQLLDQVVTITVASEAT